MKNNQTKQTFSTLLLLSVVAMTCFMHVPPTFGCTVDSIMLYTGRSSYSLSTNDTFRIPKGGTVYYVAESTVTNPEHYRLVTRLNKDANKDGTNTSWDYSCTNSYDSSGYYLWAPELGSSTIVYRQFNYVGDYWFSVAQSYLIDASGALTGNAVSAQCAIEVVGVGSVSAGDKTSTPGDPNTLYIAKGNSGAIVIISAAATPEGSWPQDNDYNDTPFWYIDDVYQAGLDGDSSIAFPIDTASSSSSGKVVKAKCGTSEVAIRIVVIDVTIDSLSPSADLSLGNDLTVAYTVTPSDLVFDGGKLSVCNISDTPVYITDLTNLNGGTYNITWYDAKWNQSPHSGAYANPKNGPYEVTIVGEKAGKYFPSLEKTIDTRLVVEATLKDERPTGQIASGIQESGDSELQIGLQLVPPPGGTPDPVVFASGSFTWNPSPTLADMDNDPETGDTYGNEIREISIEQIFQSTIDDGEYYLVFKNFRDVAGNYGPGGQAGVITGWQIRLR